MSKLELKIPPPIVALITALLMWAVSSSTYAFNFDIPFRLELAVVFLAVGVSFDLSGLLSFRMSRTTINPLNPKASSSLVASGVYRFTRNPMYVGLVFILAACGLYWGATLSFIFLPVFVVYITRFQIIPEERILGEKFGEDYRNYLGRVRRWL